MAFDARSAFVGWLLSKATIQRLVGLGLFIAGLLVFAWWCIRHPKYSIPPTLAFCAGIYWWSFTVFSWTLVLGYGTVVFLAAYRMLHCSEIDTWRELVFGLPRLWKVYRRWNDVCAKQSKLAGKDGGVPSISDLRLSTSGVIATINTSPIGRNASVLKTYEFDIAAAFEADRVLFRRERNWLATFRIDWGAHLRKVYRLHDIPESSQRAVWPYRIPFGVSESGKAAELLANEPILLGGQTGSGKSTLAWAILAGYIKLGIPLKVDVIDPKSEFSTMKQHLGNGVINSYTGGAEATPDDYDQALGRFYAAMKARSGAMGDQRLHIPTVAEPVRLLIIDEGLPLAQSLKQKGVSHPLVMIASQGRATNFIPLFLTQAAQKDVLGLFRDLTSNRISMKTASRFLTEVVLGEGCEGDGARCSDLDLEHDKGVGYQVLSGGYAAFRGPIISDADAGTLAEGRLPDPPVPPVDRSDQPHIVYRLWDADDNLLYVGKTGIWRGTDPMRMADYSERDLAGRAAQNRMREHLDEQPWANEIADVTVYDEDIYPNEAAVDVAEQLAIRTEAPRYNKQHNQGVGPLIARAKELSRD